MSASAGWSGRGQEAAGAEWEGGSRLSLNHQESKECLTTTQRPREGGVFNHFLVLVFRSTYPLNAISFIAMKLLSHHL